jgi:hypothetical protein
MKKPNTNVNRERFVGSTEPPKVPESNEKIQA